MKRLTAVILASCLLLTPSLFAPGAVAEEHVSGVFDYTVNSNNTVTITGFEGEWDTARIIVPQTLEGHAVTGLGPAAFSSLYELESLTLPDGLVDIGSLAFFECESLKEIFIPATVTSMGDNPFNLCPAKVRISAENPVFEVESGAVLDKTQRKLVSYPYGDERTAWTVPAGTEIIGARAFDQCTRLIRIGLPDGLFSIEDEAFIRCVKLTDITLPATVKEIGGWAFGECFALTAVFLPEGLAKLGDYAFSECSTLVSVDLPKSLESIGMNPFVRCPAAVSVPESHPFLKVDGGVLTDEQKRMLISYPFASENSQYTVSGSVKAIGDYAFAYCGNLKEVTFPEGLENIGEFAFLEAGLAFPMLPRSLGSIGRNAFESSSLVEVIVYPGSAAETWAQDTYVAFALVGDTSPRFDFGISSLTCLPYGNLVNLAFINDWQVNIGYFEEGYHITGLTPDATRRIALASDSLYGFIPAGDRIFYLGSDSSGAWGTIMDIAGAQAASEESPESSRLGWTQEKLPLPEDAWAFYADENGIWYTVALEDENNELRRYIYGGQDELIGTLSGVVVAVLEDNSVLVNDLYNNRLLKWKDGQEETIFSPKKEMNFVWSFGRGVWAAFENGCGPVADGQLTELVDGQFWDAGGTTDQFVLLTRPKKNAEYLNVTLFNEVYSAYVPLGRIALSEEMRIELTPSEITVWGTLESVIFTVPGPKSWKPY